MEAILRVVIQANCHEFK